jgi:nitrate reductase alpha subunit
MRTAFRVGTMPSLAVVTRDYPAVYRKMTALGPLAASAGVGSKGVMWKAQEEVEALKASLGTVVETGCQPGTAGHADCQAGGRDHPDAGSGDQWRDGGQSRGWA